MKKIILVVILILVVVVAAYFLLLKNSEKSVKLEMKGDKKQVNSMKILSRKFQDNEKILAKYTCDGENINPPLTISGIPEGAKSLVLIVDDPDAPISTWVHWTMWNIAPDIMEIKENSVPKGTIQGFTSFGKPGYGGPCPPSGIHHYHFKLYAIDALLDLPETANKMELEKEINGKILAETELVGLYSRER